MRRPPILTAEERNAALEKARSSRSRRSAIKADVRAGNLSMHDVIELVRTDDAIAKMRVVELLESFTGVGKVRAIAILDRLGISKTRRLQGLGIHQRDALIKEFAIPRVNLDAGSLIVLSGPGGVGKSTVSKEIRKRNDFWVSVSATTRAPRGNEVHGVSQEAVALCDGCIEIPQLGTKHSLNISVSAGIVVWDLFSKMNWPK